MYKIDKHVKGAKKCKIENHLKTNVVFDDFEPLGGPISQKTHKFLMFFNDFEPPCWAQNRSWRATSQ